MESSFKKLSLSLQDCERVHNRLQKYKSLILVPHGPVLVEPLGRVMLNSGGSGLLMRIGESSFMKLSISSEIKFL